MLCFCRNFSLQDIYLESSYIMRSFTYLLILSCSFILLEMPFSLGSSSSLVIIIRSQSNSYHNKLALRSKNKLSSQIEEHGIDAEVVILHHKYPVEEAWVVAPVLPSIAMEYSNKFQWALFLEETTQVDLLSLTTNVLTKYNYNEPLLVGHCLHDKSPTIIHHYKMKGENCNFPDFDAGFALSNGLLSIFLTDTNDFDANFQIDVKHELAMYLKTHHRVEMTCDDQFCGKNIDESKCVTYVSTEIPVCESDLELDDVQFSVKTTKKFHDDRLQVVLKTWGKYAEHITYYSNVTDPSIPTIDCGIPNTERGHCGKMEKIINDMNDKEELAGKKWLVIADDDTILSVSRMLQLLRCYDHTKAVVLGERYGYGLSMGYGYSYITGGGGMVMSRKAVSEWAVKGCKCPSIDTPDDMILGQCFSFKVGVPVVHSPLFHQARPEDYADGYLANQTPISFHKHWMVDPLKVYDDWFAEADKLAFGEVLTTPTPDAAMSLEAPPVKDEL